MSAKKALQTDQNKLDKLRHKLASAQQRGDQPVIEQFNREIAALQKKIASTKEQLTRQLGLQGSNLKELAFHRALSKAEQADMGKLKKAVKGLQVVHPLTALGREMGIAEVTGYAPQPF